MKIGIGLPNHIRDSRLDLIPAWARRAERRGFSSLGTLGHIADPGVMDSIALAAAAGGTDTIGIISNVLLSPARPAETLVQEIAAIDGVSGGRLTLGVGLGTRPDDFVMDDLRRPEADEPPEAGGFVYREMANGKRVIDGSALIAPVGAGQVPVLFGTLVPDAYERVARLGDGFIGASVPATAMAPMFDAVRAEWARNGREGSPRLVAIAHFAFADLDEGRSNVWDFHSSRGSELAYMTAASVSGGARAVRATVAAFEAIGADELILNPTLDDLAEVDRLADVVM